MAEFIQGIFGSDFLPHGWCYRWDPFLVWLHVVSDFLIAIAYYLIPFSLAYIIRRRGDLVYPWMFWLFVGFILACGTTHLMSVLVVWQPWYRLDGFIKLITATASVPTAVLMMRVSPAVVALPSPEQLRLINGMLEQEVAERKAAEAEVRRLNADLERRVAERTAELEQANQRLQAREQQLTAILDGTPLLVYIKDREERFVFVNKEFERAFDWKRSDVLGKKDEDLFPADAAQSYVIDDKQVWQDGQVHEFEEYAYRDGQKRSYMSIKFLLFETNGQPWALCGMSADITERKRAEEALRRYNSELEAFAYVSAHDLQEPLRTVKTFSQLIGRRYRGRLDADADDIIAFITGGIDRMQQLISDLQTWSAVNRSHDSDVCADANVVLAETLELLQITMRKTGAQVVTEPLPTVHISPAQLRQIFQNLISNAIKYRSTQPPKIRIEAVRRDREYEFSVRDNGQGFEMQYAEQIFGVFRRLHGRDIPGTGIGLAIVKKIVESHGGRILVSSSPGEGADFRFTLPGA